MKSYIFILGSNPILSKAEINCFFHNPPITSLTPNTILLKLTQSVSNPQNILDQLGGTIKILEYKVQTTDDFFSALQNFIIKNPQLPRDIGISYYNFNKNLFSHLIKLKKELKQNNLSKRFVINNEGQPLNAATINQNRLLEKGVEIVLIKNNREIIIGQTIAYQNIDSYTKRDYGKPKPDPISGMLPPKLAQIMLNLGHTQANQTIYDPFCGSGVILQEALLRNISIIGSDISQIAVNNTIANLKWLNQTFKLSQANFRPNLEKSIFCADATKQILDKAVDAIITEPFLGPPLKTQITPADAISKIESLLPLYRNFLINSTNNLKKSGFLVMVLPVFQTLSQTVAIDLTRLLDQNLQKNYNIIHSDLIYSQPNQRINRQLLVLQKITNRGKICHT